MSLVAQYAAGDPVQPGWFQYAVELRTSATLIGDVGVCLHDNRMQADLGYTIAAEHHRKGYTTEAVRAVLDSVLERGVQRVSAECDARNRPSAILLRRLGFQDEGYRPAYTWIKGEWTDDLLFGLLSDRWERSAGATGLRSARQVIAPARDGQAGASRRGDGRPRPQAVRPHS